MQGLTLTSLALSAIIMLLSIVVRGQTQYGRFTTTENWMITSGSALAVGGSFLLQKQVKPFTPQELTSFEQQALTGVAAWPSRRFDSQAAKASDALILVSALLPATAFIFEEGRKDFGRGAQMYGQVAFLNFAVTNTVKSLVRRPRPYAYNPNAPEHVRLSRDARMSFYSGHVSTVASFSFFAASVVHHYSDQRGVRTAAWAGAAILPALTGYLRMRAGKHFLSDVAVGYAAGAAIGFSVPLMHRNRGKN
jgi:membrane-associated phospholipid phosphatase